MTNVTLERTIPVPPAKVWDTLRTFRLDYFPNYPHDVTGEGLGTTRTFKIPDGEMQERINAFDDAGMSLGYEIVYGPWPVSGYQATVTVSGDGENAKVVWSADFEPAGADEETAVKIVAGTIKMNLGSLDRYLASE